MASTKAYTDKSSFYHLWQFEWDFQKDKSFKDKMASVTSDYCTENRTSCALKDARRKRWSLILYRVSKLLNRRRLLNKTHYREWGWGEPDKVFYEKKRQPFHIAVTYDIAPFQLTYKLLDWVTLSRLHRQKYWIDYRRLRANRAKLEIMPGS